MVPLVIAGCGLGLLVSQLNNYTLAPIEEERISEAAGVNSAAGSFGLSFGLAMAGGHHARRAVVQLHQPDREQHGHPAGPAAADRRGPRGRRRGHEQHRSSAEQIAGQPPEVEAEVLAINDEARNLSLQVALLVPLLAGLLGLGNSFRMLRLPDVKPSASLEGLDFG